MTGWQMKVHGDLPPSDGDHEVIQPHLLLTSIHPIVASLSFPTLGDLSGHSRDPHGLQYFQ